MSLKLLGRIDGHLADLASELSNTGFLSVPEVGPGLLELSEDLLRFQLPGVTRTFDVILEDGGGRERHLTNVTL